MIDATEHELLAEVLRGALGHAEGVDRVRFRKDHYQHIKVLDGLQRRGLLGRDRDGQAYRLPLATLALLDTPEAKALRADMARLFDSLRHAYLENLHEPVPVGQLATSLDLGRSRVMACFRHLDDTPIFAGHTRDLTGEEASITPGEPILAHDSFNELLDWVKAHDLQHESLDELHDRLKATRQGKSAQPARKDGKVHGNVEVKAVKREQVLGAAVAVLAAFPENCTWKGQINGKKVAELIEAKAPIWFRETGEPPLSTEVMARLINSYLNTLR